MGLRHRCEFWGRGWRQKEGYRRSASENTAGGVAWKFHQEKLKLAVSSRIRFSRFIFFSFILRF